MDKEDIVIYNVFQAIFYIKNNLRPVDYKISERDGNVGFVFNREETKPIFKLWMDKKPSV